MRKHTARPGTSPRATWITALGLVAAAAAVVAVMGQAEPATAGPSSTHTIEAAQDAQPAACGQARRFRATRPIAIDKQTGRSRMPTAREVEELVTTLSTLTSRPESLPEATVQGGGVGVALGDAFGGVVLARPNEDGTLETRCVFTFDEGIEFLGLVEDQQ